MPPPISRQNRRRVLDEVISLEAWHDPFVPGALASIHVDAVFLEARLGAEEDSPIRFKLKLRRAELLFIIPPNEPLEVLQETVSRDQSISEGRLKLERSHSAQSAGSATAQLGLTRRNTSGVYLEASSGAARSESSVLQVDAPIRLILTTQSKTADGHYRWDLRPAIGEALEGKPWDAILEPRLSVRDTRVDAMHLEGSCRVEVRCRREDLIVDKITLKDSDLLRSLSRRGSYRNRLAAAEAYIRMALTSRDLDHGGLYEPFSEICLADVLVEMKVS